MRDSTAYGIGPIHNIVLAVQNEASIICCSHDVSFHPINHILHIQCCTIIGVSLNSNIVDLFMDNQPCKL